MKVVVGGHVCLDMIPGWNKGSIDSIIPGYLIEMDGIKFATGGAVANTGLTLNKLGVETTLLGKIGSDTIGGIIRDMLEKESKGITDKMIISKGETSSYTVVLNPPDTDRVFLHFPGTNDTFTADDIPYQELAGADLFHFGYPPLMKKFYQNKEEMVKVFKKAKEMGLITSLDLAMPAPNSPAGKVDWKDYLQEVLPYVDVFVPSIDELLYMFGISEQDELLTDDGIVNVDLLEKFGEKLIKYGALIVGIKLGDKGLYLHTPGAARITKEESFKNPLMKIIDPEQWTNRRILSPCFQVEVKGTTGSGDATIAGFLAKLLEGVSPEKVLTVATAVGACCVESVDATGGITSLTSVMERLKGDWKRLSVAVSSSVLSYDQKTGLWKN